MKVRTQLGAGALVLAGTVAAVIGLSGATPSGRTEMAPAGGGMKIDAATFGCIRSMTPVGRFYVGSVNGQVAPVVAVAQSKAGGVFPPGSIVQLVPGEVMVKREAGFNAKTKDWEFFELDATKAGTVIRKHGAGEIVNRFGGNCLSCHEKAEAKFDMICSTDHGCDPIPLNIDMIRALQKTDPRCASNAELTESEKQALALLLSISPPADKDGKPS